MQKMGERCFSDEIKLKASAAARKDTRRASEPAPTTVCSGSASVLTL